MKRKYILSNLKDENGQFDPDLLIKKYDYSDSEVIDNNLKSIDKIFITNNGKTYEIEISS